MGEIEAAGAAASFRALGDPVRLRLLSVIASCETDPLCVCELASGFTVTGPTISHHLKVLRQGGLIHSDRHGNRINYRADLIALNRLGALLTTCDEQHEGEAS
ncbi:ArsR family transcriptional regulator [Kribbella aluminosa]|uniref:ArsR family transcriptional regulator n=1 Tax=Kribbella aluminosa TaxID=416017 RepID=A0ABS4V0Z0_9ACTN|nr:metalloregulator ArsR/SmtB family transcription factor [Kribbella aluminosa]MBP2348929.1 ArsR family transcriptional regulator [Kribbella aluminosa]MBP2357580.1 ArsR family transcriptional regulator [Kribbella aluminosa]